MNRALEFLDEDLAVILMLSYGIDGWPLEVEEVSRALEVNEIYVKGVRRKLYAAQDWEDTFFPQMPDLHSAIPQLDSDEQLIIKLLFGLATEGLTHEQIGRIMGLESGQIHYRVRKAKDTILESVGDEF